MIRVWPSARSSCLAARSADAIEEAPVQRDRHLTGDRRPGLQGERPAERDRRRGHAEVQPAQHHADGDRRPDAVEVRRGALQHPVVDHPVGADLQRRRAGDDELAGARPAPAGRIQCESRGSRRARSRAARCLTPSSHALRWHAGRVVGDDRGLGRHRGAGGAAGALQRLDERQPHRRLDQGSQGGSKTISTSPATGIAPTVVPAGALSGSTEARPPVSDVRSMPIVPR